MLEKKEVYIGIYSSSRNTIARAEDMMGNVIGFGSIPDTININISIKHSWEIIKHVIAESLRDSGIDCNNFASNIHVSLGIKNTELVEACLTLKKQNNQFKTFIIAADGYVLLRGSHAKDGAIIILDDGVVGNAIMSNKLIKIGGWGFPHADKGSIPWIGLEAIRLTIQWLDGFIEESFLLKEIYRHFNNDIAELVKWAMCSRTSPKEYHFICDIVLNSLYKEDKYALSLISSTASEASKLYRKLLDKSGCTLLPCCLHGELVPYVKHFLEGPLVENLVNPLGDGARGAISLLKDSGVKEQDCFLTMPQMNPINFKQTFTG